MTTNGTPQPEEVQVTPGEAAILGGLEAIVGALEALAQRTSALHDAITSTYSVTVQANQINHLALGWIARAAAGQEPGELPAEVWSALGVHKAPGRIVIAR